MKQTLVVSLLVCAQRIAWILMLHVAITRNLLHYKANESHREGEIYALVKLMLVSRCSLIIILINGNEPRVAYHMARQEASNRKIKVSTHQFP